MFDPRTFDYGFRRSGPRLVKNKAYRPFTPFGALYGLFHDPFVKSIRDYGLIFADINVYKSRCIVNEISNYDKNAWRVS